MKNRPGRLRTVLSVVARVAALTVALAVCFAVAGVAVKLPAGDAASSPEAAGGGAALLAVCLLDTLVLSHLVLRSRWSGWRLAGALFFVFYGTATFMAQIESVVFLTRLPPGVLPRLFLMGALVAAPFALLAVAILGRWRLSSAGHDGPASPAAPAPRLAFNGRQWVARLAIAAGVYLVLYFGFGYYVAWRNPAVLAYYGGIDEGTFFAHLRVVVSEMPWLVGFQVLRALLWVAIALPVVRMLKGGWTETALALGLLFAVVMNAQLLLPNPYMPEAVRMAHLAETASSNFLFGWLLGWLFARPAGAR